MFWAAAERPGPRGRRGGRGGGVSLQLEGCPSLLPDAAAFTNLSLDHLDRHGTMRAYGEAKRRLFLREHTAVALAVVGVDDALAARWRTTSTSAAPACCGSRQARPPTRRLGLGVGSGRARHRRDRPGAPGFATRLAGRHNALNALIALALADGLGLSRAATLAALEDAPRRPDGWSRWPRGKPVRRAGRLRAQPRGRAREPAHRAGDDA